MDLLRDTLKRKKEGLEEGGSSQIIEDCPSPAPLEVDSDSSGRSVESFASAGQVEIMQAVMGYHGHEPMGVAGEEGKPKRPKAPKARGKMAKGDT